MNKPVLYVSMIYQVLCQTYFGWDFKITSDAELICAGFAFLILALSFLKEGAQ
jgi:hypothetical protein